MKKILKLICIFILFFTIATMPLTLAEAKKRTKRASYKVSKSISKKTPKNNKKTRIKKKKSNRKKLKKTKKKKLTKNRKNTKKSVVPSKRNTLTRSKKEKITKLNSQKQQNKILDISLPSQKQDTLVTKNGLQKTPQRCPNVRCRYMGIKPCPRHGKDYPNHWK